MLGTGTSIASLALRGTTALSQVLRPILTANPSVTPLIAVVGEEVTRTQGTYTPNGGGSVNITVSEFRVDGSQVATGASYTPLLSGVGGSFAYFEQATQTGGDADGQQSTLFTLTIGTIVHAQASATGSIPDQNLTHTGDVVTVVADVSTLFSGAGLSYAVSGYAGASLNGNALEIDPTALTVGATITLTASNTNPTDAEISFNLVVEALDFASLSLAGSGLIGATHTATATANRTGATFSYNWQDDQGSIGAPDQNTYSPVDNQDQEDLSAIVSATLDGVTVQQETNSIAITYAAPTAAGALVDQSFTEDTGLQAYDVSGDFTGAVGGSYSVQSGPVTVNAAGVVSHDTDSLTPQTGTSVVIRYTNSGGFADSGYSLDISAPAFNFIDNGDGTFELDTEGTVPSPNVTNNNDGSLTVNQSGAYIYKPVATSEDDFTGAAGSNTLTTSTGDGVFETYARIATGIAVTGSSLPTELADLGADLYAWYDFKDSANMFTGIDFTGAVSDGSIVGSINDKSGVGSGKGLIVDAQSTAGPAWRSAANGHLDVSANTGADGVLLTVDQSQQLSDGMEIFVGVRSFEGDHFNIFAIDGAAASVRAALGIAGNGGSSISNNIGSVTYWNGDPLAQDNPTNIGNLHTLWNAADPSVFSLRGVDTATHTAAGEKYRFLARGNTDDFSFAGEITDIVMTQNLSSKTAERTALVSWLAGRLT